jgi:hypothetical protein
MHPIQASGLTTFTRKPSISRTLVGQNSTQMLHPLQYDSIISKRGVLIPGFSLSIINRCGSRYCALPLIIHKKPSAILSCLSWPNANFFFGVGGQKLPVSQTAGFMGALGIVDRLTANSARFSSAGVQKTYW